MAEEADKFAEQAPGVQRARSVDEGAFIHEYRGRLSTFEQEVRFLTLAPGITGEAVAEAFAQVAGQWHNPSTHPNVVTVHDRGNTPGPWLATDIPEGNPLDATQSKLSLPETRTVIKDTSEALRNAHLYNTMHLDLRPDHVSVDSATGGDVQIRVDEWGLERACRVAGGQHPVAPHTAPELLDDPASGTKQTDVYGLGVVAYYAVTGHPPITPDPDIETAIRTGDIPPPSTVASTVPTAVGDVILKALATDPSARYDSSYAFQTAITSTLPEQTTTTPETPADSGTDAEAKQPPDDAGPAADDDGRSLARRAALGLLLLGALGVGGFAVAEIGSPNNESGPTGSVGTEESDDGDGGDSDGGGGDGGDGGGGSTPTAQAGQAGERVPTLVYEYWTDTGTRTAIHESDIPIMNKNFQSIGVDAEVRPEAFSTQVAHTFADARHMHYILWGHSHAPDRLDPTEFHFRFNALWAGDNGRGNPTQFANCEHTLAADQVRRTSGEKRRQAALQAQQIMSEEVNCIPITPAVRYSGYNTQAVSPGGLGKMKFMGASWRPYVETEAKSADRIVINHLPVFGESKNYQVINDAALIFAWSNIFFSPLVSYDENFQMTNVLAENINVNSDATRFEITLKDDIQFTNGEEITAEDVRWTVKDFIRANADELPKLQKVPVQSSEVVDEKNLIFKTKTPFPAFVTRNMPRQGIQHKETAKAAGAGDNPRTFMTNMDPVVGSGILEIDNFQQGQLISAVPNDGHPTPPNLPVSFRIFDNVQSAFRQFQNGNMNMIQFLSPTIANERLANVQNTESLAANGFMHDVVFYPQHSWSPGQFTEFNAAVGWTMDAQQMAQVGQFGDAKPHNYSITISPNHPWYPTKIGGSLDDFRRIRNEDGSPNPQKAKQLLRDNGWTFDDNDRLRYPSDKDISPQWPQGQQPSDFADQWPCTQEITR